MRFRLMLVAFALVQCGNGLHALAQEGKAPFPMQGCYAARGPTEIRARAGDSKKLLLALAQGAFVAGYE